MGKRNGSPRTPQGNDGGDEKEFLAKKQGKSKPINGCRLPPLPPAKVQWFRCNNRPCFENGRPNEWTIPLTLAASTDHCPECGSSDIEKIDENQRAHYQS